MKSFTLLFALIILFFAPLCLSGTYSGGSGTVSDPYIIANANDLQEIGTMFGDWGANFEQINDIDLSAFDGIAGRPKFNLIGTGYRECNMIMECWIVSTPFSGTFNGNGFSISNFRYDDTGITDYYYIGLFGLVDGNARIENVVLKNPQVDITGAGGSGDGIGPLAGFLVNGVVDNCSVLGGSISSDYRVGGLVGLCDENGLISNCSSSANVSGHADVGGLVGSSYYGQIARCYAVGNITGTGSTGTSYWQGGLVGSNYYGSIDDCYATGDVTGVYFVGGLTGENRGPVTNCYAIGSVSGTSNNVGGLIGYESVAGTVVGCFWNTETCLPATSSPAGTGKTTAEMQMESTFINAGWDFVSETTNGVEDIWKICEATNYPKLSRQIPLSGDFVCPDGVDYIDFAYLADRWLDINCDTSNDCAGADLDLSTAVGLGDLLIFTQNWLK